MDQQENNKLIWEIKNRSKMQSEAMEDIIDSIPVTRGDDHPLPIADVLDCVFGAIIAGKIRHITLK